MSVPRDEPRIVRRGQELRMRVVLPEDRRVELNEQLMVIDEHALDDRLLSRHNRLN